VQQRAAVAPSEGGPQDKDDVYAAAAKGIATSATSIPHGATIQQLFGPRHDVSRVQAHTGPEAAASAAAMGAKAYATGDHLVLGNQTDLHTVAHEAAHVVQQRGGVQLKGGVGEAGDAYERHADAVADKVVRGESAEVLLDQHGTEATTAPGVQRQEQPTDAKAKAWPGGPTVARKTTTHTLAEYVGWLRQVEGKYGAAREETLQRLRRLYYSEYTGGVGYRFDAVIKTAARADGPPMTTADLPLTVINGLYETNAIATPNGSEIDVSHIFADLDMRVAGAGLMASVGEVRFGVTFEGAFTWAGDLASWWLEAKNTIKKRGGTEMTQSDQVAILMSLVDNKVAKDDIFGDLDAQVMADQFTTTTIVPAPEAAPLVITTQDMPLSAMLTRYYDQEAVGPNIPAAEQKSGPSASVRGNGPSPTSRFHYFVAGAKPRIPHTRQAEKPLTVALASDAAAQIREHLANTAHIFINKDYFGGTPDDLTAYGPLLDEVTARFVRFLTTGLTLGDAPWP